ncbi:Hypothetical predicted protein [Paramuricea clavata]|uniref:Integrase core domain-containing protein n=1 Tax=Paramuricea clavata TaxID=317549 RepID=A0A7D9J7M3_PARCT|nr:Hypothetical predicted protein [Paramuricea clavata]
MECIWTSGWHTFQCNSQQIERWWRELHERLEKFFKHQINWLKDRGHYDPHSDQDRMLIAFLMIPVLQKQLDSFKDTVWNCHRIRTQKETLLPDGVRIIWWPVTEDQLKDVAELSGVLELDDDFIQSESREKCERIIPFPGDVEPDQCADAYVYLKDNFLNS